MITIFILSLLSLTSPSSEAHERNRPGPGNTPGFRTPHRRFPGDHHFQSERPIPGFHGATCPPDSISMATSADGSEVAILFSKFQVQVGGTTGKNVDRIRCDFDIPLSAPPGMALNIYKIDYRGFNFLPEQSQALFQVFYDGRGFFSQPFTQKFYGTLNDNFTVTDSVVPQNSRWSRCGEPLTLKASAVLTVQTNTKLDEALVTLDSADVAPEGGVIYSIQWKRCDQRPRF